MKQFFKGDHSQKGFTMFEVMIALILIALIFVAIPSSNRASNRNKLETAIDDIDRAVRFAQNEAILRNTIVRVKIEMDSDPIKYSVEAGPKGEFVIKKFVDKEKLSLKEKKLQEKKEKTSAARFNAVSEFKESAREFPEVVKIIGFSSNYTDSFVQTGEIHIYFQASGRRDEAIIIFSTDEEVASLEIMAFSQETKVNYSPIDMEYTNQSITDVQQELAKELFEQWIKD